VHLPVEPQAPHHLRAHGLERAAVVVEVDPGGPGDEAVREERGEPPGDRVLPLLPPAAHHVQVFRLEPVHEERDVRGIVLEIAVGGHHHRSPRPVEAGGEGGGLPEVAPEEHGTDAGIALRQLQEALARPVSAPVVHEHELEGPAQRLEARRELPVEVREVLDLVVEGDHDGHVRTRSFGLFHRTRQYSDGGG
jgi:hypothetical protein